jgi:Sodium:dicarboxylate symporter family
MELSGNPPKKSRLTLYIIIALFVGIAAGFVLNKSYISQENKSISEIQNSIFEINKELTHVTDSASRAQLIEKKQKLGKEQNVFMNERDKKIEPFSILADIFLRLIKMIVAPLVLTTLIVGVAKLGDISSVGRIGGKTLLWFISASLISLMLGAILVNVFKPGLAMNLPLPDVGEDTGITRMGLTLKGFLYHVFPTSLMDAMAKNEILQIVVFSLFFGVATAAIGEQGKDCNSVSGCSSACDFESDRLRDEPRAYCSIRCDGSYHRKTRARHTYHVFYFHWRILFRTDRALDHSDCRGLFGNRQTKHRADSKSKGAHHPCF